MKILFNKPLIAGKELYFISQSVMSGHISGDGVFSQKCEEFFEQTFSAKKVLLTTSCTSALEMAGLLCHLSADDEVILPSYTFVSTANAFKIRGINLKFVDIRSDTKNLDETLIEQAITDKTKAIVPVHYAGVSCEMDEIMKIADKHDLFVIEDAAQGVNATYKGQYLGTIGDIGAYSFHETKNYICGEGGAIILNDEKFIERSEILRQKGTNRNQFFRGEVEKYTWVDIGSSYVPSDMLAAFLYGQLEHLDEINQQRKLIYSTYYKLLEPLQDLQLLSLPVVPGHCQTNYHMFYILVKDLATRSSLISHLKQQGVQAVFHYIPLHTSPMGEIMGYQQGMLPVTETISEQLLRLPFYYELSENEIEYVVKSIFSFFSVKYAD